VWGHSRAERYRRDSAEEPALSITGNPAWDPFRPPASVSLKGDAWLWVTRPHRPDKCYAPSRLCGEGLDLLEALLDALEANPARTMQIKPHPYDYPSLYAAVIAARGMQNRVALTDMPVLDLLPQARVVITEDSTAGLEAMLFGKPLVHAHFAPSAPTAAFSEHGAALPALTHEGLGEALARMEAFSDADCAAMHAHQRRYLEAHAGPLDGGAMPRVAEALRALALRP